MKIRQYWQQKKYGYEPASDELEFYVDTIRGKQYILSVDNVEFTEDEVIEYNRKYGFGEDEELQMGYSEGDDLEIVKMLEYYWETGNDASADARLNSSLIMLSGLQNMIVGSIIDHLVEEFEQGRIVTAFLLSKGHGCHAVNAYKIVEDQNDPNILYLKVYDKNFANDMFWSKDNVFQRQDVTITLKRVLKVTSHGMTEERFEFDYAPIETKSYHWGNFEGQTDALVFVDANEQKIE